MNSFKRWTKHPKSGEWKVAMWLDDALGPHHYGVQFEGEVSSKIWDPEIIKFETDPDRELPETGRLVKGPDPEPEYDEFARAEIKEHQLAALNWLIGQCEDQFVRAWIIQQRDRIEAAGTTPEYY